MPPTRNREVPPHLHSRILELQDIGWSYSKIALKHELSKSTVQTTCRRALQRGPTQVSCSRPGTPRVITEDERDQMVEAVELNPGITYLALQAQEAPNASLRSIKRLFQEMNMRKWARLKRPALTENHA